MFGLILSWVWTILLGAIVGLASVIAIYLLLRLTIWRGGEDPSGDGAFGIALIFFFIPFGVIVGPIFSVLYRLIGNSI